MALFGDCEVGNFLMKQLGDGPTGANVLELSDGQEIAKKVRQLGRRLERRNSAKKLGHGGGWIAGGHRVVLMRMTMVAVASSSSRVAV